MPKKVPFRVIYCTGWEDDYPPKDLEVWERERALAAFQMASGAVLLIFIKVAMVSVCLTSCSVPSGAQSLHKRMEVSQVRQRCTQFLM